MIDIDCAAGFERNEVFLLPPTHVCQRCSLLHGVWMATLTSGSFPPSLLHSALTIVRSALLPGSASNALLCHHSRGHHNKRKKKRAVVILAHFSFPRLSLFYLLRSREPDLCPPTNREAF